MALNLLQEKGIPMEKQFKSWADLNSKPYDKESVHPYTRTRGILMNGIEVDATLFKHEFARHTDDMDLKRSLGLSRRVEQQQQKAINWMIPGNESNIEVTLGYEQVAVDLTAYLAQTEPDDYVRQALDFALLEDFDHLYRYANYMKMIMDKDPSSVTKQYTEITLGRPTAFHHRHPIDEVRNFVDYSTADPLTKLHIQTITAAEQQTMNFYMNVGDRAADMIGRGLYLEIGQVEEQHVSHYESLADPRISWFEMLLNHELNECWLYYSLMNDEPNADARKLWEDNFAMEIEHLKHAAELMKMYEKRDPAQFVPADMSTVPMFKFQSNIDYIRGIIESQLDYTASETRFMPLDEAPGKDRFISFQAMVNAKGNPSETVVDELIMKTGNDYRNEIAGAYPIEKYRRKEAVAAVRQRIREIQA
ncbi:MAG TPA: hypothetical protein PKM41_07335 [Deltaproteobacteria bacterium]|nr:hypothetical protein [Deltaproteobacteria bacterium]HOI06975.1 hypothetical protein [Deltaproteobacteria bacterium]